jgi:hypothetical protein
MKSLAGRLACAALLAAPALPALAVPVTWTLTGVTFDDGASASGWFVFDADAYSYTDMDGNVYTGVISDYHISTGDGGLSGKLYDRASHGDNSEVLAHNYFKFNTPSFPAVDSYLQMITKAALTNAGGSVSLETDPYSSYECDNCSPLRLVSGGTLVGVVSSVPEPSSYAMLLAGLGLAGAALRRARRT